MKEPERIIRRSVIDRLTQTGEPEPRTWSESARLLKRAVLRDVEWLLNTRRIADPAGDEFPELQQSVYHYGLPDVTSVSADSMAARRQLVRQVEQCLQQFEPRLTSIRVTEAAAKGEATRSLRFVVEGLLRMHPEPEPIAFDTVLDSGSGRFNVTGSD
jgi:type VI secretion system protein ImpF